MLRLAVRVNRAEAELALAELLELMPDGVEEVDIDAGTVEYAVYGAPGELPELPALRAAVGDAFVEVSTTEVSDDWADRWREFHKPLVLGKRLSVRPPWEPSQGTELELIVDPGRAFGTGAHATTRLCLELLLDIPVPGQRRDQGYGAVPGQRPDQGASQIATGPGAVDLGCGSGVLAIAAAKLGWPSVLALDYDPVCVDATRENALINGVELLGVSCFDLRKQPVPATSLVLANLLAPLLLLWAEQMPADDAGQPRQIVASGLLASEADTVLRAFEQRGYEESRRLERGEWAALLVDLRQPGSR